MPSETYRIIRDAILNERQITCAYQGHRRELCPHIVGWTNGNERLLAWQFGGETSSRLLPHGGAWKCLDIGGMTDVRPRQGDWHSGSSHQKAQTCVQTIDLDINVHVRAGPR